MEQISRYDLSFQNFEPRGLLVVKLRWHDHLLTVAVTHLGLRPAERRHQSAKLLAILAEVPSEPLVVMGDFNEWLPWGAATTKFIPTLRTTAITTNISRQASASSPRQDFSQSPLSAQQAHHLVHPPRPPGV